MVGGRSNDGTIEVVGGGGLMLDICLVLEWRMRLVGKLGEQAMFGAEVGRQF